MKANFKTMNDIVSAVNAGNHAFFSEENMKAFQCELHHQVWNGAWFISKNKGPFKGKVWLIHKVYRYMDSWFISTEDDYYSRKKDAIKAVKLICEK